MFRVAALFGLPRIERKMQKLRRIFPLYMLKVDGERDRSFPQNYKWFFSFMANNESFTAAKQFYGKRRTHMVDGVHFTLIITEKYKDEGGQFWMTMAALCMNASLILRSDIIRPPTLCTRFKYFHYFPRGWPIHKFHRLYVRWLLLPLYGRLFFWYYIRRWTPRGKIFQILGADLRKVQVIKLNFPRKSLNVRREDYETLQQVCH